MNELLLLSKEYISKDDFLNEINIKKYHFELGDYSRFFEPVFCLK